MKKFEKSKKSSKSLDMDELETISGGEVVCRPNADGSGYYFSTTQQEKIGKADLCYYKNEQDKSSAYIKAKNIEAQYAKKSGK